ncbi:MAG: phage tail protein [Bacteroidia bacterium]|nr:phage tail protein [Bacteroidia bacterium]
MPVNYPPTTFHFEVAWGGSRLAFTDCSGLNFTTEMAEYRDGNTPDYHTVKIPGMHKFGNITLKRGIQVGDNELFQWMSATNLNKPERRTLTVSLLDETHAPIIVYTLENCWVTKFDGITFKSTGNDLAIESVELVTEKWTVAHV